MGSGDAEGRPDPVFELLEVHHRKGASLRIGDNAGDLGGRDDAARGDVDLALDVGVGLGSADLPEDRADHEQRPTPVAEPQLGRVHRDDRRLDFEKGFFHIRQRADAYNQMGEPKSRAGYRDIPAGPMVLNALRRWKLRCPKSDLGLVFPAPRGGILQHTNTQARFRKLQEKVEVTMRWHDLRHFAVSLWIEQGFSIKEIMTFAGHSSIQMTMERYGHLFPSPDHQKAMAMVEAKLLG